MSDVVERTPVDAEVLARFIEEAEGYLALLRAPGADEQARTRALQRLREAAGLVGLERIERDAARAASAEGATREELLTRIASAVAELRGGGPASTPEPVAPASVEDGWDPETTRMLRDIFAQEADEHFEVIGAALLSVTADPERLAEALRRAHTLKGSAATVGFDCLQRAAHLLEERLIELRDGRLALEDSAVDVLLAASDLLRPMVAATVRQEAEQLLEQFAAQLATLEAWRVEEKPGRASQPRVRPERVTAEIPVAAAGARPPGPERRRDDLHMIRVDADRVDELMNAIGQLVIDRTRIERRLEELRGLARDLLGSRRSLFEAAAGLGLAARGAAGRLAEIDTELADVGANLEQVGARLAEDAEGLRRTTRLLQEQLTRVRMTPIRWLFARLQRPLRELARTEGKQVELVTVGEATEMGRSVVEKITDPLIHLIRNAVAHGIEVPAERGAAGKPEVGRIEVSARHQGDFVIIEVGDDGAGLDPQRLRRALAGWGQLEVDPGRLSDAEVLDCIFLSGFSTRPEADSLAGRGLGLDVVRGNIAGLGGAIFVDSTPGKGTRFTIRLPLTTAIVQALLFKVGDAVYAIPVGHVVETLEVDGAALRRSGGVDEVRTGAGWIPLIRLPELFGEDGPGPGALPVVVVGFGQARFAASCRRLIGPREIVLRRLGPLLAQIPLFAGATVSGSGKVQLVLDVATLHELLQRAQRQQRQLVFPRRHPRVRQLRVLLADDSRAVREAVAVALGGAGYAVELAADGQEAWERLERGGFDLLLTDLEMPRLAGPELIERCRADPRLASVPIAVLTSRTAEENRNRAFALGADAFLAKPVNRPVLLETVASLVRSDQQVDK